MIMKIHGYTWKDPFNSDDIDDNYGFVITLPISPTVDNTLGESIFGLIENLQEKNDE